MYQAFADESMSGEGEKTLLLAACVQRYQVWADFSFHWEATLALPPAIDYFKMREARQREGQFDWRKISTKQRDDKIRQLSEVIAHCNPQIIFAWISRKEFDEVVEPIIPYMMRHPYTLIFYPLIIKMAEWQHKQGKTLPIDFVFDQQGPVDEESVVFYSHYKRLQRPEIAALMGSTPVFRDDKLVLPLQAADIAAWHRRRLIDKPESLDTNSPTAALDRLEWADVHLNREFLLEVATQAARLPGIKFVHDKPEGYSPGMRPEDIYKKK